MTYSATNNILSKLFGLIQLPNDSLTFYILLPCFDLARYLTKKTLKIYDVKQFLNIYMTEIHFIKSKTLISKFNYYIF